MARLVIGAAWPLFVATVTTCFNLEPRIAIVKYGEPESYFGFSVSQHQIVSQDRLESLLLVGKLTSSYELRDAYTLQLCRSVYMKLFEELHMGQKHEMDTAGSM